MQILFLSLAAYILLLKRLERQVEKGLNDILKHVEPPDCPRNISTRLTDNKQITVYSRIEALSYFKDANYLDCRVSVYAPDSKRLSIAMIDIDLENFKSKREFNKAHVDILFLKKLLPPHRFILFTILIRQV